MKVPKELAAEMLQIRAAVQSDVLPISTDKIESSFTEQWFVIGKPDGVGFWPFLPLHPDRPSTNVVSVTASGNYLCTCGKDECYHIEMVKEVRDK